jgi:PKD repeat protein
VTRGLITSVVAVGSLALVFAGEAMATPTASFTVDTTPVVAWEPAQFRSTSLPTPPVNPEDPAPVITNVEWDFNDDGVFEVNGESVSHTFELSASATVDVTVRVTDNSGDPPAEQTQQVVVEPPIFPTAGFAGPLIPPVAGVDAVFRSTSFTVPGRTITNWEWDFEDDGTFDAIGPTAVYPFPSAGSHNIRLRVRDSRGLTDETVGEVVVNPPPVNAPPVAAFTAFPASPFVSDAVNLTSYSYDPEGALAEQRWELDGDGDFDDDEGAVVTGMFRVAGDHPVSLRVTDAQGATATVLRVITVRPSPMLQPIPNQPKQPNQPSSNNPPSEGNPAPATTQQPFLRLLTPFPVVRLQGAVVRRGTRIRRLTVRAPKGSRVFVFCRGKRCPTKRLTKLANRRTLRFRALERVLPARSLVQVFVRRGDQIGKYTSFLMRRKKVPKRIDGCLLPSSPRAVTCPED